VLNVLVSLRRALRLRLQSGGVDSAVAFVSVGRSRL
jgi:hypothetical protein